MDGPERARLLGEMWVKLKDVEGENEVGYLAIAEEKDRIRSRLVKKRVYQ